MDHVGRQSPARVMMLVGVAYTVIGIVFAVLDDSPDITRVRLWRLAAWVVSAGVGVAHTWYEHHRRGNAPRTTAVHTAAAVALGAFGLALAANVHWLFAGTDGQAPLLALPIWPAITALPVFLVTLAVAATLARLWPRVQRGSERAPVISRRDS